MSKFGIVPHFTVGQLFWLGFVVYANFQVFKWVFLVVKRIATADLLSAMFFKLTPRSVIQKTEVRKKLKVFHEKKQKEKDHQESLENHRKYKTPFFTLSFIAEDRATLFKGHDGIKWKWGNQRIDSTNPLWVEENRKIAFMMFQEMVIYRNQFQKHGRWSPEMEIFWKKILPKQFVAKKDYLNDLAKQAEADFENDTATKASA